MGDPLQGRLAFVQPPLKRLQRQAALPGAAAQHLHPSKRPPLHLSHTRPMPCSGPSAPHLCCCGGTPGEGHRPSALGHSYPGVGPEVGAEVPGAPAASEVLSVSCGNRVIRGGSLNLLPSATLVAVKSHPTPASRVPLHDGPGQLLSLSALPLFSPVLDLWCPISPSRCL